MVQPGLGGATLFSLVHEEHRPDYEAFVADQLRGFFGDLDAAASAASIKPLGNSSTPVPGTVYVALFPCMGGMGCGRNGGWGGGCASGQV